MDEKVTYIDVSGCSELKLLEQSFYKNEADASLIAFMLSSNYSTDSDSFREYHDRYVEQHTITNILKEKIYKAYVPEDVQKKASRYTFDFEKQEIRIDLK